MLKRSKLKKTVKFTKQNETKDNSTTFQNWDSGTSTSAAGPMKSTKNKPPPPPPPSVHVKEIAQLPEKNPSISEFTDDGTESESTSAHASLKQRNLHVSKTVKTLVGYKSSRFIPAAISGFKDVKLSFKTFKNKIGVTKSPYNWQSRVHVFDGAKESDSDIAIRHDDPHDPRRDIDALSEAKKLKAHLLAGKQVSIQEIEAVKFKMLPEAHHHTKITRSGLRGLHKDMDKLRRKKLSCIKGIIHIPTPHKPLQPFNTFGSPADLRISLSNQDTPEFQGRRRLFFDFSEFRDEEIQLSLESARRLVIEAKQYSKSHLDKPKASLSRTEIIDLPRDLPVDNLRIVRDAFGNIVVEEAWKFK